MQKITSLALPIKTRNVDAMGESFSLSREKEVWRDSGPLLRLELVFFFFRRLASASATSEEWLVQAKNSFFFPNWSSKF